jgi:hypothetical protein
MSGGELAAFFKSGGPSRGDEDAFHSKYIPVKMLCNDKRFCIDQEHIPAVLAKKGILPPVGAWLQELLRLRMPASMPLMSCMVDAQWSPRKNGSCTPGKAPENIFIELKFPLGFQFYEDDPAEFEDKVKRAVLFAMGLDPDLCPPLKNFITVEDVTEDLHTASVEVLLVVGVAVIFAAAFTVACKYFHKPFTVAVPVGAAPPASAAYAKHSELRSATKARYMRYIELEDRFELIGAFEEARPKSRYLCCCECPIS